MYTIAIVGRPNVGKSTLFNRLAGKKLAIVHDLPGVTRDWREAPGSLFDLSFRVIDTAGLEDSFDDTMPGRMRRQTESALGLADAILFVIDGRMGVTPMDQHFADRLRRHNKPVILIVNKAENPKAVAAGGGEAYALGLGDPVLVSAEHGTGLDDLYEALSPHVPADAPADALITEDEEEHLPGNLDEIEGLEDYSFPEEQDVIEEKSIKVAIVGRPNVGKSTLLNAILGESRVITGPEAGLTRDSIAVDWVYKDRPYTLVDTAGLRRKSRIHEALEKMSVTDSLRAIRLCHVALLVLDATAAFEKQDLQLADHILNEGRALVIVANKWDLVTDREKTLEHLRYKMDTALAQGREVTVVSVSALNSRNIENLLKEMEAGYDMWNTRIRTGGLNRWLVAMESQNPAPMVNGRPNRLKYMTQIKARPPTFGLWLSRPDGIPDSYKRYIINGLRKHYNLGGTPIRLLLRKSKNPFQ